MRAGIIAAGWGSRLGGGPKALTPVAGHVLIDLVLAGLVDAGIDGVTCIINEASQAVRDHVQAAWPRLDVQWIVKTTPTSMHSFLEVLGALAEHQSSPCLMTTVDSVCPPGTVADFVRKANRLDADLGLGVTTLIEDEKPLYAVPSQTVVVPPADGGATLPEAFPIARLSSEAGASAFVTSGFYWVSPSMLSHRDQALAAGFTALRQFLGCLIERGARTWGIPMPPIIDVDRPEDVAAAERLLRLGKGRS